MAVEGRRSRQRIDPVGFGRLGRLGRLLLFFSEKKGKKEGGPTGRRGSGLAGGSPRRGVRSGGQGGRGIERGGIYRDGEWAAAKPSKPPSAPNSKAAPWRCPGWLADLEWWLQPSAAFQAFQIRADCGLDGGGRRSRADGIAGGSGCRGLTGAAASALFCRAASSDPALGAPGRVAGSRACTLRRRPCPGQPPATPVRP